MTSGRLLPGPLPAVPAPIPAPQRPGTSGCWPGSSRGERQRGLLPPGPDAAALQGHQSRLQGWLVLGGEPAPSPHPPQTFLRNGIFFPVHLLPTHRVLPNPVCRFKPHQPCLFLEKGGTWEEHHTLTLTSVSHLVLPPCPWVCSRGQESCIHSCDMTTLINFMLTNEKTQAQRG